MKTTCTECYCGESRATPLFKPLHCLQNHLQYICGSCGRCICIDRDKQRGLQRWNYPFKSLEIAKLYLRTADVTTQSPCGIYEITSSNGRKSYKIFRESEDLQYYLKKNKGKQCESTKPLFIQDSYKENPNSKIKMLSKEEVERYLAEQQLRRE